MFRTIQQLAVVALVGALAVATLVADAEEATPAHPPLILFDFENAVQGQLPFRWRTVDDNSLACSLTAARQDLPGRNGNKAARLEYAFAAVFSEKHAAEAGCRADLPAGLEAVIALVKGDGSKNLLAVRLRDASGEMFEFATPIDWEEWRPVRLPVGDPPRAHEGGNNDGRLDPPLAFDAFRVIRTKDGAAKGEVFVDDLGGACAVPAGGPRLLYDPARDGIAGWRATGQRAVIAAVGDAQVMRGAENVPALKCEYEYLPAGANSFCEFGKPVVLGESHGTVILEVFGDGSNNLLRFRCQDADGRVWQGTWTTLLVDWYGFRTVFFDTRALQLADDPELLRRLEKFPARFQSLLVDDVNAADRLPGIDSGRKGEIYLGRIWFLPAR